jgi:hypothetical protein
VRCVRARGRRPTHRRQEVLVKGSIPYDDILAKIKKTGKEVSTLSVCRAAA